jgi:hypothetical protein
MRPRLRAAARTVAACAAFAAAVAAPHLASAAGLPDDTYKALPCRPTVACTADIVPAGALELEVGWLRRASPAPLTQTLPALLKLSLSDALQLQLASNTVFVHAPGETRALDDGAIGLKLRVVHQAEAMPAVAFSLAATAQNLGDDTARGAAFIAYVTKDFGPLHFDLNLGANAARLRGATDTQPWAALALSTELPKGFGAMIEGYVFGDATPFAQKDAGLLWALVQSPAPWLIVDAGADVALFTSTRSYNVFVGATIILAALWGGPPAGL